MIELHGWILLVWTGVTVLMAAASAWGAMKYQQKAFSQALAEVKQDVKAMEVRLTADEADFIRRSACEGIRHDCGKLRDFQEHNTCRKLEEVKKAIETLNRSHETSRQTNDKLFRQVLTQLAAMRPAACHSGQRDPE